MRVINVIFYFYYSNFVGYNNDNFKIKSQEGFYVNCYTCSHVFVLPIVFTGVDWSSVLGGGVVWVGMSNFVDRNKERERGRERKAV